MANQSMGRVKNTFLEFGEDDEYDVRYASNTLRRVSSEPCMALPSEPRMALHIPLSPTMTASPIWIPKFRSSDDASSNDDLDVPLSPTRTASPCWTPRPPLMEVGNWGAPTMQELDYGSGCCASGVSTASMQADNSDDDDDSASQGNFSSGLSVCTPTQDTLPLAGHPHKGKGKQGKGSKGSGKGKGGKKCVGKGTSPQHVEYTEEMKVQAALDYVNDYDGFCHGFNNIWEMSNDPVGCRKVQAALDGGNCFVRTAIAFELLTHAWEGQAWDAVESPYANHVLQKCIEVLLPGQSQPFFDALMQQRRDGFVELARHLYGCRIFKLFCERCGPEQLQWMINMVVAYMSKLIANPSKKAAEVTNPGKKAAEVKKVADGVFVIQHFFDEDEDGKFKVPALEQDRCQLAKAVLACVKQLTADPRDFHRLVVVAKALEFAPFEERLASAKILLQTPGHLKLGKQRHGKGLLKEMQKIAGASSELVQYLQSCTDASVEAFDNAVAQIPVPGWITDVHSHKDFIAQHVHSAEQVLERKPVVKRNAFASDAVLLTSLYPQALLLHQFNACEDEDCWPDFQFEDEDSWPLPDAVVYQ